MSTLLLVVIYFIFISLGLPDSLIGSSWPSICESLKIDESLQGVLTIVSSLFTIISSFLTVKLLKLFSERSVVICSIILTVTGLLCVSFSGNFIFLILSSIPLGLGAGAIDSTLNNYVAIHYKALHLNWLHAFWGVGASLSPFIVSIFLTDLNGWRNGALCLALIQGVIFLISLFSFKLWDYTKLESNNREVNEENIEAINYKKLGFFDTFRIKGVACAIIAFFSYIAIESLSSAWFSSMMVYELNVEKIIATRWTSYFFIGIMSGRFLAGFLSLKIKDKWMIRIGEIILLIGVILLTFKFNPKIMPFAIGIIGFGCAPIYPAIVHATPSRFTNELSQNVMSVQIGCAYIATLTISPLFGVIGKAISFYLLPFIILLFFILLILCNEITLYKTKDKTKLISDKLALKLKKASNN